jgi:hypothetical protein
MVDGSETWVLLKMGVKTEVGKSGDMDEVDVWC